MPNASCTNLESLALYLCRFLLILFIVYIARSIFTLWYLSIFYPVEIGVGKFSDLSSSTNTIPSHVAYQNTLTEHTRKHLHTKTSDGNFPFVTLILTIKKQFSYFPIFPRSHSTVHLINSVGIHL